MEVKELMRKSREELVVLGDEFALRGMTIASMAVSYVLKYGNKQVRVVKGRKVPVGTEGECFWIGSRCHSKYGDPWGIYTSWRCGIKDADGEVYWTSLDNIEVIEEEHTEEKGEE